MDNFSSGLPVNWVLGPMAIDSSGRLFGADNGQVFRTVKSTLGVPERLSDHTLSSIMVFPNPTTGIVSVQTAPLNNLNVSAFNLLGETVMEQKNLHSPDFTLDLSKLVPGTYYIRFSSANSVVTKTKKIIKN